MSESAEDIPTPLDSPEPDSLMVETPAKEKPLDDTGHARKLNLDTNDEDDIENPPSKEADTSQRSFSRTRDTETNRNSPTESSPARSRKDFDDIKYQCQ